MGSYLPEQFKNNRVPQAAESPLTPRRPEQRKSEPRQLMAPYSGDKKSEMPGWNCYAKWIKLAREET